LPSPSTSAHEPNQLKPFYAQHADWTPCDTFECASISVPLDYSRPGGKTVTLALLRREADNPDQKLGSLFVNPGGPGVSGIDYARQADSLFTQPVLDHYDIIGWDPRGVGDSTSITCLTPQQTDALYAADGTPDDPAEVHDIVRIFDGFTKGCVCRPVPERSRANGVGRRTRPVCWLEGVVARPTPWLSAGY
jgi:hypothetical protein